MSVVLLVRHAQASFGAEDYDRLSDKGHEQARVLGKALGERVSALQVVATGTQRRHRETAEGCLRELGESANAAPRRTLSGLDEFDHDELIERLEPRYAHREELAAELMQAADPRRAFQELFARATARWTSGAHDAEYRESWPAFRRRCLEALGEITAALPSSGTALVFTSGGPITAICQELLQIPDAHAFRLSWSLVNGGVTKLVAGSRGLVVSTVNEHAHFEGARRDLLTYR